MLVVIAVGVGLVVFSVPIVAVWLWRESNNLWDFEGLSQGEWDETEQ